MPTFNHIKTGDMVTRLLAGEIPMKLEVSDVTDTLIITSGGWTFDRTTGGEVDEDLGWTATRTGSFLVVVN